MTLLVDRSGNAPLNEMSASGEHDLVARLGMLAPDLAAENIAIDGPLWVCRDGWGHLLNHHYLRAIELARAGGSAAGPKTTTPEPFEQCGGGKAAAPRLFGYINGGHGR